jgi:hypothetical protein
VSKPKKPARSALQADLAQQAQAQIQSVEGHEHVTVLFRRGHLVVENDGEPVARLTLLGASLYGLSFRTHTGRWEAMPGSGGLTEIVDVLVTTLGPYLARTEFPGRNSRSDH